MLKILTKCSLNKDEALDKISKGAKCFEIHTKKENIDNLYKNIGNYINLIKDLNMDIRVVHSPINCGFDIEDVLLNFKQIEDVFFLSNEIGKLQNRVIYVILHMNYDLLIFDRLNVKREIFEKLRFFLNAYKNTNIVIENVMAVDYQEENGFNFRVNFKYEADRFVKEFNKTTNSNTGTVFDVCHAMASIELLENYRGIVKNNHIPSIEDYINNFADTLKVVHLAYSKNLGLGKSHGLPYESKEEIEFLERVIRALHNKNYDGLITIEVAEDNYLDTKNWITTKDNLYKVFDKLKIKKAV